MAMLLINHITPIIKSQYKLNTQHCSMNKIEVLNSKLSAITNEKYPIDLTSGKMGLCIYFYYLSRWEKNDEYTKVAEKLLNDVINLLSDKMEINVENGLAGIALGISHLVKEKYVTGDINEILEDVDSRIYKSLAFLSSEDSRYPKPSLLHLLYYLYIRYTEQINPDSHYIFRELIIKIIEMFCKDLKTDFFNERFSFSLQNYLSPLFLYMVSKLYEIKTYEDRINRILDEVWNLIASPLPILQSNRLYLLWGLLHIKPYIPKYQNEIAHRLRILKDNIDIENILNIEMKNQDIYLINGVSTIYILLFSIQVKFPAYKIDYDPQVLRLYNESCG